MKRVFYFVTSKQSQQRCIKQSTIHERSLEQHRCGLPGPFSLSLSVSLVVSLVFEDRRRKIEIVTYSRVPFVRMSTGRHGAQLHRRPIVPQSRFVTVIYGDILPREIAVEASNGRLTLLFPVLFTGMSRATPIFATCFRRSAARCCLIFHWWEPLAYAHAIIQ